MSYESQLGNLEVTTDADVHAEAMRDPSKGFGLIPRDYSAYPINGFAAKPFDIPDVDPSEYQDRCKEMEENKNRKMDQIRGGGHVAKDQTQTPDCWCYAGVGILECLNILQGSGYVNLSANCPAAWITKWRNRGGFGSEILEQLMDVGTCEAKLWPNGASGFNRKYDFDKNGDSEQAQQLKKYRITGYCDIEPGNKRQLASAGFMENVLIAFGDASMGHEYIMTDPAWVNNMLAMIWLNSWGEWKDHGWTVAAGSNIYTRSDDAIAFQVSLVL